MNIERLNGLSITELQLAKDLIKIDNDRCKKSLELANDLNEVYKAIKTGRDIEILHTFTLLHDEQTLKNLGTINQLRAFCLDNIDDLAPLANAIINASLKWIEEQEQAITLIDQLIKEKQQANKKVFATLVKVGNKREVTKRLRTLLEAEPKPTKRILILLECVDLGILSNRPTYKQFSEEFGSETIKACTFKAYINKATGAFKVTDREEIERKLKITFAQLIENSTHF